MSGQEGRSVSPMRRIGLLLLGVLALAALVIAFLPLRWVTDRYVPGLQAERVEGSVWKGRIRGARYQGLNIGDVDAGLALAPLLRGEAEIGFARLGEPLAGRVTLSRGSRKLSDVGGSVTVSAAGLPLVLGLQDVAVETDARGRCRAVSGTVTATVGPLPMIGNLPQLAGQPRCDGEAFHAPLALPDGASSLDMRLWPTGRWQAALALRNIHPIMAGLLETAGFARTADGLLLQLEG
jgi:general secretion pathway protein N